MPKKSVWDDAISGLKSTGTFISDAARGMGDNNAGRPYDANKEVASQYPPPTDLVKQGTEVFQPNTKPKDLPDPESWK